MKTTVDAFGAEVIVGDLVVFKGQHKYLEKGLVVKCTPHGATVACGIHKTNVRSERICKMTEAQLMEPLLDPRVYYRGCVMETCDEQQVIQ